MEMNDEQIIPVDQNTVWAALNDPGVLKICIPGCESIDKTADNEYKVIMTASVGPVKAKFNGKLILSNINPPNSYSIAFEGSGGAAGFGKGGADVSLSSAEGGTKLSYTAKAQVGGKLAQVGSRLIDGVAKKMANDFFTRFKNTVAPMAAASPAAESAPAGAAASPAAPAAVAAKAREEEQAPAFNPLWLVGIVIAAMFGLAIAMGN
jgi:carbon monoxide dehydrogenase subunit G